jgi:hypothetical protein
MEEQENLKETKEFPQEIDEAINNRGLTEVQGNLLFLIIAMSTITLTKIIVSDHRSGADFVKEKWEQKIHIIPR